MTRCADVCQLPLGEDGWLALLIPACTCARSAADLIQASLLPHHHLAHMNHQHSQPNSHICFNYVLRTCMISIVGCRPRTSSRGQAACLAGAQTATSEAWTPCAHTPAAAAAGAAPSLAIWLLHKHTQPCTSTACSRLDSMQACTRAELAGTGSLDIKLPQPACAADSLHVLSCFRPLLTCLLLRLMYVEGASP